MLFLFCAVLSSFSQSDASSLNLLVRYFQQCQNVPTLESLSGFLKDFLTLHENALLHQYKLK